MQNQPNPEEPQWNILDLLKWTSSHFKSHAIDNPRATAEILLAYALDLRRIDLYLRHDQPLTKEELNRFRQLIIRRLRREPVAYIVGCKEFWSLELAVTPAVLIPRPETECLVEAVLGLIPAANGGAGMRILEMGTGSGAISLAVASERSAAQLLASDASPLALELARRNAVHHRLAAGIHFVCGTWFDPFNDRNSRFDMILSNPPYIPAPVIPTLQPEIHRFEPIMALDGGPDGLRAIRHILARAPLFLKDGGWLLLEIGHDQAAAVQEICRNCGAYADVRFIKDYSGHSRVLQARKKG